MKQMLAPIKEKQKSSMPAFALPDSFLNAYAISNASELSWEGNLYKIHRVDRRSQTHEERGDIKNVMWKLRRKFGDLCKGYGYIIDVTADRVVIPLGWKIPNLDNFEGYKVYFERTIEINPASTNHIEQNAALGLIREGIKGFFKNNKVTTEFGELWQEGKYFCQKPKIVDGSNYYLYRRFYPSVKVLRGNQVVVQFNVGTAMIDDRTFGDYFFAGDAEILADYIAMKQGNKLDRKNQPIGVRVLRVTNSGGGLNIVAMDLQEPSEFAEYATFSIQKQRELAEGSTFCSVFPKDAEPVPFSELVLILDSQITQDDHSETIIEPDERFILTEKLRDFINGAEVYNQELELSSLPFDASELNIDFIAPPAIFIKGKHNKVTILPAPTKFVEHFLKERVRNRTDHIRKYGFLEERPINPLLAYPRNLGEQGAKRMQYTLNEILDKQGINAQFSITLFDTVEEIRKVIEKGEHDALLAVLPNPRRDEPDFHEQIKKNIEVPSQCIKSINTLHKKLFSLEPEELVKREWKTANRLRQRYELCIWNLLVKHHWIPFVPADPFNFNVQVGLDVGGKHNNRALSCLGYGFSNPRENLIFRPDEIPLDTSKAEPIPKDSLFEGLDSQFKIVRTELVESNIKPDYKNTLFYRDGQLLGDGDKWNETDALKRLHSEWLKRKWISENSIWTAVEVMKYADGWRLFNSDSKVVNPLAGVVIQPFNDDDLFLVCTTGRQYLSQGTAGPILVRITDIHGKADRRAVIRDLIWQTDMCFTKTDTALKLPWVLQVADTGALQLSRSYKITGITA